MDHASLVAARRMGNVVKHKCCEPGQGSSYTLHTSLKRDWIWPVLKRKCRSMIGEYWDWTALVNACSLYVILCYSICCIRLVEINISKISV